MPMPLDTMTPQTHHETGSETPLARLPGQSVAVVGAGRSGLAAAALLIEVGARVSLVDRQPEAAWAGAVPAACRGAVRVCGGERCARGLDDADLVVVSPGVPPALEALEVVRRRGVPIVGEVELASWMLPVPVIGVTGTNGKSTVVSLVGRMLEECGRAPFVGGNIGRPLSEGALAWRRYAAGERKGRMDSRLRTSGMTEGRLKDGFPIENVGNDGKKGTAEWGAEPPFDVVVAELSSFQLETIDRFHPRVAALLNITPDHLDRYATFEDYAKAKAGLFRNQTPEDVAVLNADDAVVRGMRASMRGQIVEWSLTGTVPAGAWVDGDVIVAQWKGTPETVMPVREIPLAGAHNVSNVLAAVAVGTAVGCSGAAMRRAVRAFRGLPHACEVVRVWRGVTFVDDSKGTNVEATVRAIESLPGRPLVIILGGRAKGRSEFERLREPVARRGARCIVLGETAAAIADALAGAGDARRVGSLAEGVSVAAEMAAPGGAVLLSPSCASFDMFRDYQDRGRQFRELVEALPAAGEN